MSNRFMTTKGGAALVSDLRRTFKTLGKEARVPAGPVPEPRPGRGYNIREVMGGTFLMDAQERLSQFFMLHLNKK